MSSSEASVQAQWNSLVVSMEGNPPLKIKDGKLLCSQVKNFQTYYEVTTKYNMMNQIALHTAYYYRSNNMTKPRFIDIEIPKLTVKQIMANMFSPNVHLLTLNLTPKLKFLGYII